VKILATSDLHGHLPEIPTCDLLLIAGDICPVWNHEIDFQAKWLATRFRTWLQSVPARKVVGIAGNHDWVFQIEPESVPELPWTYLQDSGCEFEGLRIYGTPWQPPFCDWAFNANETEMKRVFQRIPYGLDVLLSHGPPYGFLDANAIGLQCGSIALRNAIVEKKTKSVVCGHVHEGFGCRQFGPTTIWNVSLLDSAYRAVRLPVEVSFPGAENRVEAETVSANLKERA
jgi:Icc-related predicted phosphoesterase